MNNYSFLEGWATSNPSGFWLGLILPMILAVIAFGCSTLITKNQYSCKHLLLAAFIVGLINFAAHELWVWPSGIYGDSNLGGGRFIVAVMWVPHLFPNLRRYNLMPPNPWQALWITWVVLFFYDVVMGFMQPGEITKFEGIGAGGLKDGLFLMPIIAAAGCALVMAVQKKSRKND